MILQGYEKGRENQREKSLQNFLTIEKDIKKLQKSVDKSRAVQYYNTNKRNELLTQIQEVYSRETRENVKLIRFDCTVILYGG